MSGKRTTTIILCCGRDGKAVVIGDATKKPAPGEAVTLYNARMVLFWDAKCRGLFGLAANGPKGDTKITAAVDEVTETVWQEYIVVSEEAKQLIDGWLPW